MKLIIQNNAIAATATDEYQANGTEQAVIDSPADFDISKMADYIFANGAVTLNLVPQAVSMRQARLALLAAGSLDNVTAAVTAAGQAAQIQWDYASEIRRDSPLIVQLTPALGMTAAQIDSLFIQAATL